MKIRTKILALTLCALMLAVGCSKKTESSYVTLGQYKALTIEKTSTIVSEEQVDEYVASILSSYAVPPMVTDRAVANGDTVNINYRGLLDGVAFEGGTADDQTLVIGSGQFIEGFESGLIGVTPGAQVNIDLTFPEVYHSEELAGKAVVFEVTVNYIHGEGESTIPEPTDEWVSSNLGYDTLEKYRESLRAELEAELEAGADSQDMNTLIDSITEGSTFAELPQDRIETIVTSQYDYYEQYAAMYGMTFSDFLTALGTTEEEFATETRAYAESNIKRTLLLEEIAKAEGIKLTNEDRDRLAVGYGFTDYAEVISSYDRDFVETTMLSELVMDFLRQNNTFA